MYGARNDQQQPQQWSVHAEFTISHDGLNDPSTVPQTRTEQDENGVRMVYTWTSQPPTNQEPPTYNFQRGNLLFSSTPPKRNYVETPINRMGLNVQDSGYGSDLFSQNSSKTIQPYNRRCRSTCSIVLSTNFDTKEDTAPSCARTQSLRCQTPTLRSERTTLTDRSERTTFTERSDRSNLTDRSERKDSYYGCGDPWCYHAHSGDDTFCKFSTVPEEMEDATTIQSKRPSRASTFNLSDKTTTKTLNQKDASVQTFEMIDKCTSPFMKVQEFEYKRPSHKKRAEYNARRQTEPIYQRTHSPSTYTPDSLESQKVPIYQSI